MTTKPNKAHTEFTDEERAWDYLKDISIADFAAMLEQVFPTIKRNSTIYTAPWRDGTNHDIVLYKSNTRTRLMDNTEKRSYSPYEVLAVLAGLSTEQIVKLVESIHPSF